jgi:hypothetical protein
VVAVAPRLRGSQETNLQEALIRLRRNRGRGLGSAARESVQPKRFWEECLRCELSWKEFGFTRG